LGASQPSLRLEILEPWLDQGELVSPKGPKINGHLSMFSPAMPSWKAAEARTGCGAAYG